MEKVFNNHHQIPKSKGGLTNDINVSKVEAGEHARWHTWCWNDTPVEAICRVLLWNDKIWNDNFIADLMGVLDNYIHNYYAKKTHSWFIKSEAQKVVGLEEKI